MHERGARGKRSGAPLPLALAALSALGWVALACSEPAASPSVEAPEAEHVATAADFEGFRTWERIAIESPTVPTKARPGPVAVYVNHRPPSGATSFPTGTVLVKTVESGDDPRDWTVHAMVKRGGLFNPTGAVGWEFFGLQLTEDGRPVILWRSEGDNDGHSYSAGLSIVGPMGTPPGAELTCIDCHTAAWQDDDVLTPALSLRASPATR